MTEPEKKNKNKRREDGNGGENMTVKRMIKKEGNAKKEKKEEVRMEKSVKEKKIDIVVDSG